MTTLRALFAVGLIAGAVTSSTSAELPEPPPSPPRRTAGVMLRGGTPPVVRGEGRFRELSASIELVLDATDQLPGQKQVSLLAASDCEALDAVGDDARHLGDLTIGDDGRGRMTARLGGVSIDPQAPNTIIGALVVVHTDAIEACGRIEVDRLETPNGR